MMARILVVDDDDVGRASLAEILRLEGHGVEEAPGGRSALERVGSDSYDVVLLDLKMPDLNGVVVLEEMSRLSPQTEVIIFTAHGSLDSAIQAVRHGAYDYLLKPAGTREILSCVAKAAERHLARMRVQDKGPAVGMVPETRGEGEASEGRMAGFEIGGLTADVDRRRLRGPGGEVELTPAELRLLTALHREQGAVVSYGSLVDQVQGYRVEPWEAAGMLRPVVSRLRFKIRQAGGDPGWISTVRGSGYALEIPEA